MSKVKLPKEVAEAIENARNDLEWSDGNILAKSIRGDWESQSMQVLNDFCGKSDSNKLLLAQALVNGFEVEMTPEDKVRELYEHWDMWPGANSCFSSDTIASVIVDVVNTLGHKIKGVNA